MGGILENAKDGCPGQDIPDDALLRSTHVRLACHLLSRNDRGTGEWQISIALLPTQADTSSWNWSMWGYGQGELFLSTFPISFQTCQYEAQEQYRLDKLVDTYIVNILQERIDRCIQYHMPYIMPCGPVVEDYEEAELNWFIKYGELGTETDAIDVLMKQKHRMIWERRHPEIMEERAKALAVRSSSA